MSNALAAARANRAKYARMRQESFEAGILAASNDFNPDFVGACAMYWGEGAKSGGFAFVNCDPEAHRLVARGLFPKLSDSKFRFILHGFPEIDVKEAERFWNSIYGIQFEFSQYREKSKVSKRKIRWKNGMLMVKGSTHAFNFVCGAIFHFWNTDVRRTVSSAVRADDS